MIEHFIFSSLQSVAFFRRRERRPDQVRRGDRHESPRTVEAQLPNRSSELGAEMFATPMDGPERRECMQVSRGADRTLKKAAAI